MSFETSEYPPCPLCGHHHGPPMDFCRYPANDWVPDEDPEVVGFPACGCPGV